MLPLPRLSAKLPLLALCLLAATLGRTQAGGTVDVAVEVNRTLRGPLAELRDAVAVTLANDFAEVVPVYAVVSFRGRSPGIENVFISNAATANATLYSMPPLPAPQPPQSLRMLEVLFPSIAVEDFDLGTLLPWQRELIEDRGILPPGEWEICVEVFDDFGASLTPAGTGLNCADFSVTAISPPQITTPVDMPNGTWLPEIANDAVQVLWTINQPADEYLVELARFTDVDQVRDFYAAGKSQDEFNLLPNLFRETVTLAQYNFQDAGVDFEVGEWYALRVTAFSATQPLANQGRSNIVVFAYGVDLAQSCERPTVTAEIVYPAPGDTLPYVDNYILAEFTPACPATVAADAALTVTGADPGTPAGSWDYEPNDWRFGPGAAAFLRRYFRRLDPARADSYWFPEGSGYERRLPFIDFDGSHEYVRGERYTAQLELEFTHLDLLNGSAETRQLFDAVPGLGPATGGFVTGMPRPRLGFPAPDARVRVGEPMTFSFTTGEPPAKLLPPMKSMRIDGATGEAMMPWLKVSEKCVLQVATHDAFALDSLLVSRLYRIQVNTADAGDVHPPDEPTFGTFGRGIDDTPERRFDESRIRAQLFPTLTSDFTPPQRDTLYWRVVWLRAPDDVSRLDLLGDDPVALPDAAIYHASPVRRLVVGDEADAADSTGRPPVLADTDTDNDPTDCTTGCDPGMPSDATALSDVSGIEKFRMGYFSVRDLEVSSSSGGELAGTGVVTVDFMFGASFRVAFSGVRVNADLRAVAGEVTGVEAGDFDLADVNDRLAGTAASLGVDGSLNGYLQEVPELRLLGELATGAPVRLPVGLDREIDGDNVLLAITALRLTPAGATVRLAYEQPFDFLTADSYLTLGGEVCVKPSGFGAEVLLHLTRDLSFDLNPADTIVNALVLKGSSGTPDEIRNEATHIELSCACVRSFGLRFEGELSRDRFLKEGEDGRVVEGEAVKFRFGTRLDRAAACDPSVREALPEAVRGRARDNNFVLALDFDPFQLRGLDGWGFRVDEAYVDLSSTDNPAGIAFPDEYSDADFGIPDGMSPTVAAQLRNTWTGFYLKQASVHAPLELQADSTAGPRFGAGVRDMLIDEHGLSVGAFVENLLDESTGSAGGWSFSIDELEMRIVKNGFRSARLAGGVGLPVMEADSTIAYDAILAYSPRRSAPDDAQRWGPLLTLVPEGDITLPAILGEATLNDNSYLAYRYGYLAPGVGEVRDSVLGPADKIGVCLAGKINISSDNDAGSAAASAPTSIGFAGMDFSFIYSDKRGFRNAHFSLASPQKMLGASAAAPGKEGVSGFPVTIKHYGLENRSDLGAGRIAAQLWFEPEINFMEDDDGGFKASTRINLDLSYATDTRRFALDGVSVGCVAVGLSTSGGDGKSEGKTETHGITLEGKVCFYRDETRCGVSSASGVAGNLRVGLPLGEVTLASEFGSTADFRYFFVDGKVVFSQGISLGAVQIMGLGGGFYYNMRPDPPGSFDDNGYNAELVAQTEALHAGTADTLATARATDPDPEGGRATFLETTPSGFGVCVAEGTIAFNVMLPIATTGDASVFNMDVGVSATVEQRRGLTRFDIVGDGYVMAEIDERPTAPVKTDVAIRFERRADDTRVFDAEFAAYAEVELGPLSLRGTEEHRALNGLDLWRVVNVNFHLEKPPVGASLWYFKMGAPKTPAGLELSLGDKTLAGVGTYLQVGNHAIDEEFMDPPALITRLLTGGQTGGEGGRLAGGQQLVGGVGDAPEIDYQRGDEATAGFALGLKFAVDLEVDAFLLYASLEFAAGFDVNILKQARSACYLANGDYIPQRGYNGYYSRGQIYAGIEGEIGLQIKLIRTRRFSLFRLGAAFHIQGGFPNPMWASGRAAISYSVLGGLIEGQANMRFKLGERCIDAKTDPFGFPLVEEVIPGDGDSDVSPRVSPEVYFVLPMDEVVALPVIDEGGDVVRTDYLRPYVEAYGIECDPACRGLRLSERYSVNRKSLRITPREYLDEREVSLSLKLKADSLSAAGAWATAQWPRASGKRGDWSFDTTLTFTTGPLPDRIPDEDYAHSLPVRGQRFVLQDAAYMDDGSGGRPPQYVRFTRDMSNNYFRRSAPNPAGGAPLRYDYKVKFYPYDGGEELAFDAFPNGVEIRYTIDERLANEMLYRVAIVRVPQADEAAGGSVPGGPRFGDGTVASNDLSGVARFSDLTAPHAEQIHVVREWAAREGDLYNELQFLTNLRERQPAPEESPAHLPVYEFFVRTSRFNTLPEKLAGMTASTRRTLPDGDVSYRDMVFLQGEEGFDERDVYMTVADAGSGELRGNLYSPLVVFHPTYDDALWRDRVAPVYQHMAGLDAEAGRHRQRWRGEATVRDGRTLTMEYLRSRGYPLRISLGDAEVEYGDYPRSLYDAEAIYHDPLAGGVRHFTSFDRALIAPLVDQAEADLEWNRTVDALVAESDARRASAAETGSPLVSQAAASVTATHAATGGLAAVGARGGRGLSAAAAEQPGGGGAPPGLLGFGAAAFSVPIYLPQADVLGFRYDRQDRVVRDFRQMALQLNRYTNYSPSIAGVSLRPQLRQLLDLLSERAALDRPYLREWLSGRSDFIYSMALERNPGTCEVGVAESRDRLFSYEWPARYPLNGRLFDVNLQY